MHHIFVLSDGTGKTAREALRAALTQFPETEVTIEIKPGIRTREEILQLVQEASRECAFIIHTLVSHGLREYLRETAKLYQIEAIDLMGPLLAQLSAQFSYLPTEQPGLFRELNKAYFQRIEAMEFAFRHDDGQRIDELDNAEIVLVGVSRTFKTPLSIYFAFKGWMVANVPIIMNIQPGDILLTLPRGRVIGLTTDPHNLASLRKVRHSHLGGATGDYAEIEYVRSEIMFANRFYRDHLKCPVVDVTRKPIEEIAFEIISILRDFTGISLGGDPLTLLDR